MWIGPNQSWLDMQYIYLYTLQYIEIEVYDWLYIEVLFQNEVFFVLQNQFWDDPYMLVKYSL